jgi:hypothetical protein
MAREMLDDSASLDLTKCDIFSLGMTIYEIVSKEPLPMNGPKWQELRTGNVKIPKFTPGPLRYGFTRCITAEFMLTISALLSA